MQHCQILLTNGQCDCTYSTCRQVRDFARVREGFGLDDLHHGVRFLRQKKLDGQVIALLTCSFYSDADAVYALVVHFLNCLTGGCSILVLDKSIPALVRVLLDRAELLELVLEVVRVNFALQASNVDLSCVLCHFQSFFFCLSFYFGAEQIVVSTDLFNYSTQYLLRCY